MHPATFTEVTRTSAASRVVAVIPARYHSTRLPGKALADIAGRTMIEHVYRQTARAAGVHDVIVATDDQRIVDVVTGFGGAAVMTSVQHRTGTDRVAEVAAALDCDVRCATRPWSWPRCAAASNVTRIAPVRTS